MALDDVLTIPEAAEKLKVGLNVMYKYTRLPGFPSFKIGRQIRVRMSELEDWIKSQHKKY